MSTVNGKWREVSSLFVNPSDTYLDVLEGQTAYLDCQIVHRDHKMVSVYEDDKFFTIKKLIKIDVRKLMKDRLFYDYE